MLVGWGECLCGGESDVWGVGYGGMGRVLVWWGE